MTEDTSDSTPQPETEELSEEALQNAIRIVLARIEKRKEELKKA